MRNHGASDRTRLGRVLAAGLLALAFAPAVLAVQGAAPRGTLSPAGPVVPAKGERGLYIVQLSTPPAVAEEAFSRSRAASRKGRRDFSAKSAGAIAYAEKLDARQLDVLAKIDAADRRLYSYRFAFNGFAAYLTPGEAAKLAENDEVIAVWPNEIRRVQTSESAVFLGLLDGRRGLRSALGLTGEDVVIGVIDSGIAPEHPGLSDREQRDVPSLCRGTWAKSSWLGRFLCSRFDREEGRLAFEPPAGWNGVCQSGEAFAADACNNKLIGARYYADGFLERNRMDAGEFMSPRDADGHGTHIATTAAGNEIEAELFGENVGVVSGMAPRARVAVYKACWLKPGDTRASCSTADLAQAIDDAVADGVDVINYSIGRSETDLRAPDDIALLFAADAGVFVAVAAGNDGPAAGTIGAPAGTPWVTTVAATSREGRRIREAVRITSPDSLAGKLVMREGFFTEPLSETETVTGEVVAVDDGVEELPDGTPGSRYDACEPLDNAEEIDGRIALVQRGGCTFQTKIERVEAAGAIAAIVFNTALEPIAMTGAAGSVSIPGVMIGSADGQQVLDALNGGDAVEAELRRGILLTERVDGNVLGGFSSRGPNVGAPDFIKPDVTAPGVGILAGHTPDVANGIEGELFQYLSGTSMSAPHVAGIAALLIEAHPDWSPAAIKSALMTSSYVDGVVAEDGETPATPFEVGAGHIAPNDAAAPGLVYDADLFDYAAYTCGTEEPVFSPADCAVLASGGYSFAATDLNVPSIGVAELVGDVTVERRVTNTGEAATFTADVVSPPGTTVSVEPSSLTLGSGETASFRVRLQSPGAGLNEWQFGTLTWRGGDTAVRSPIAARPVAVRAPEAVAGSGTSGGLEFEVAFGYSGSYQARVHGLRAPLVIDGFVDQDPDQTFTFRFENGVTGHLIEIPAAQAYARFALFDELTDGNDDLDLYLFYCPTNECVQVAESGSFTSAEEINLSFPAPGLYAAMVHGFGTDPEAGGPGASYQLLAWSFGVDDDRGNMDVLGPANVAPGDVATLELGWQDLEVGTRYLGGVSHNTPQGLQGLTIVTIDTF